MIFSHRFNISVQLAQWDVSFATLNATLCGYWYCNLAVPSITHDEKKHHQKVGGSTAPSHCND